MHIKPLLHQQTKSLQPSIDAGLVWHSNLNYVIL